MKKNLSLTKLALLALPALGAFMYACQDDPGVTTPDIATKATLVRPEKVIGGATECDVTNIAASRLFDRDTIYILKGDVRVNNGATLTIESGTVIKGDKASKGTLSIERDANIMALGTSTAPIVFTSSADPCDRRPNDWGGINIFGKAPNNQSVNQTPEGFPSCVTPPQYGGTEPNDNSGIFRYVRIEFAGIPLENVANSEKNSLTMYSVGSGTEIHHVQASYGGDDAFEWFGGTVNAHHLVSLAITDDDFDSDFGFSGNVQFGIAVRHPDHADISASNGFESDNDAAGSNNAPQTSAVFSNFTLIGPYDALCARTPLNNASPGKRFGDGLHLRRNTGIDVHNTVLTGWRLREVFVAAGVTAVTLSHNTAVVPNVVLSPAPSCVSEPASGPWATGVDNFCLQATECICVDEDLEDEVLEGLSGLSGYACTAWPAVVTECGLAEFEDFNGEALFPYFGAEILANGADATGLAYNTTSPAFVPGSNVTSAGYFRGALGEDEGDWDLTAGWLQFNPQMIPYN